MNEFLVEHARQNVWCAPYQDHQALLEMSRLTPIGGVVGDMDLLWDRIRLPVPDVHFHLYQIGGNFPPQLNLPSETNQWKSFAQLCVDNRQIVDLCISDGRQYPRSTSYIARTRDRNYIVAVQIHPVIDSLDTQPLLLRLYSNAYFESGRWDGTPIDVQGGKISSTYPASTLYNQFTAAKTKGFTYVFHNGYYRSDFAVSNVVAGDIVEYVCDPSIYRVVDFPVAGLPSFTSTLDSLSKYLLHPKKADAAPFIQYQDDVDIFLYKTENGRIKGVYYYRYDPRAVRMVTHADYAIPTATVQGFVNTHPYWDNGEGLVVRVQMRKSGLDRPLVFEYHHIHELYKLTDAQIMEAMVGVNANIPEWTAAQLEASDYPRIMRARWRDIDTDLVMDAYGYDATAKLLSDTPQKLTLSGAERFAVLPAGLQDNSTVYEYDASGYLLGAYYHANGGRHYARNSGAVLIEVLSGRGGKTINLVLGNDPVTLTPNNGYRLYVSPKLARVVTNEWVEVDPTDIAHVQVLNGKVYWLHDTNHWQGAVKQDDRFLINSYQIPTSYNLYQFSLTYTDTAGTVMYIPPGRIDVWLNKRRLIRGIDYVVVYPQIVIINKEYLTDGAMQTIDVRAYGFCKPDMTQETATEAGFVENGYISYNGRYNLRDDKVIQLTLDGACITRDDIAFSENNTGIRAPDNTEGRPYEISDVQVPIRGVTDYDTYLYRERGQDLGGRISDYLTMLLPEVTYPDAPAVLELYKVFSPFLNRLIGDILTGVYVVPTTVMTDRQVINSIASYRSLLTYDPCLLGIDARHQVIHPVTTWGTLAVKQHEYTYLARVVSIMLGNQVDLGRFLTIED